MILLIVSVILVIAAAIGIEWYCQENDNEEKDFHKATLFSLLLLFINVFSLFTSVKTGEVGIKTRFGKITSTEVKEGISFKAPWDKVEKINIKVQKYENKEDLTTSTKDMQIVENIKVSINYQIEGNKAVELYKRVGGNYKNIVLEPATQETIKAVISKYTAAELVTKRSEIALDINETLNTKLQQYGIKSVSTAINNFDFSKAYNEAIEKKAVAEQEVETAKNQKEKAKIEAETKLIKAEGDAKANQAVERTLTDKMLTQKFIEKWNGVLPSSYAGGDILKTFNINK